MCHFVILTIAPKKVVKEINNPKNKDTIISELLVND
jgi:hypothetical protein